MSFFGFSSLAWNIITWREINILICPWRPRVHFFSPSLVIEMRERNQRMLLQLLFCSASLEEEDRVLLILLFKNHDLRRRWEVVILSKKHCEEMHNSGWIFEKIVINGCKIWLFLPWLSIQIPAVINLLIISFKIWLINLSRFLQTSPEIDSSSSSSPFYQFEVAIIAMKIIRVYISVFHCGRTHIVYGDNVHDSLPSYCGISMAF